MKRTRSNKKRQNKKQPFFVDLPQDIVSKVLLRLPAKTLVRFKCVCKSWLNLISHPKFIKTHLQKSYSPTVHRLMLRERRCYESGSVKSLSTNSKKRDSFLLGIPTNGPFTSFKILGSCNGLVCIAINPIGVFLWNPSTKISKKMPCKKIRLWADQLVNFGFGYDLLNDDYKLVVIDMEGVRIYSGKSDRYRQLGYFPYEYYCGYRGEYVNGVLHWMLGNRSCIWPKVIVTINMSNENFGEIELPYLGDYSRLGVLDGCLSYLCHSVKRSNINIFLDIWVMKEYGVKDTWTKLYTIIDVMDLYNPSFCYPLCITETGEIVLNCGERILIYNPTKHTFRRMNIGKSFSTEAITYAESIVSPNIDDEVQILPYLSKEEDDRCMQVHEGRLKMKVEMMAADLTRSASNLCPPLPSSNLSPSPSSTCVFPPAEKDDINKPKDAEKDTGKGVVESGSTNTRPWINLAFHHAVKVGNLHPTFSDIKRYLVEVGQIVHDDDEVKKLLLRVEQKGWQELCAYSYELEYSLPPGTGHNHFVNLDKDEQIFFPHSKKDTREPIPESGSSGSMFPTAKDATHGAKRLKIGTNELSDVEENAIKGVPVSFFSPRRWVERAYRIAVFTRGIKHPTVSDIKECLELIRQRVPYEADSANIPDEEIENLLPLVRASGYDGLDPRRSRIYSHWSGTQAMMGWTRGMDPRKRP